MVFLLQCSVSALERSRGAIQNDSLIIIILGQVTATYLLPLMIDEMFEDAFDLLFSDLFQVNDFTVESFNISVLDLH